MKGRTVRRTGPLGVDGPPDEGGQMDASGAALAFTYSIVSLGEILRAERTMVKRPAKAHLFFLNVGRASTEIQTFEYIPLHLRTMRSPLAMSVM